MKLVARLKTISEIELFNELNVGIFCIDTKFTAKPVANHSMKQIQEISDAVHQKNKLLYAYVNCMIHEDQLESLESELIQLAKLKIDGIIINDMTLFVLARKLKLEHLIIYQPGAMNTDSYSMEYFESRNIKGITISREITLEEIKEIATCKTNLQMSIIGHGYLDMFYSKRNLLTNYAIHKGMDKDKLQNNYHLTLNEEIRTNDFYPILEDKYGTHIFRSNKLISFPEMDELQSLIDEFFIERIFLEDEEYYDTIKLYGGNISLPEFLDKYQNFDSGFYYQKTEKRKGELDEN